uniref:Uncharacterized protein n=1 Tax=Anguilla anguilla TaxID=7936 RepID=A0A0E9WM74_ANGAN
MGHCIIFGFLKRHEFMVKFKKYIYLCGCCMYLFKDLWVFFLKRIFFISQIIIITPTSLKVIPSML